MPDTEKYARTTISVPPALKEQMEAIETSVNWSALACRAFEDKLAEIAAHKEKKDMNDIVTRLRASKRQAENAQYKAGAEAGREWAGDTAEADELQRLEDWKTRISHEPVWGWEWFFTEDATRGQSWTAAQLMVFAIRPEDDEDRDAAQEFWESVLGRDTSDADNPQFAKGFVEGALDLWDEVKEQL